MEKRPHELLTEKQREIVRLRGLQVLTACPGAGKTLIIGARLALLAPIAEERHGGVGVITFTNSAADEIRKVNFAITGRPVRYPHFIGTIDSFIQQYIFQPFGHLVLGNPAVPPELIPLNSNLLATLYRYRQYKKLHLVADRSTYTYDAQQNIVPNSGDAELRAAVSAMKADMYAKNLSTISDASFWSLMVLKSRERVSKIIAGRFPFLMVDEAQDCSDVQMAIIDTMVACGHSEIMLAGDPFQAIYEFRSAKPALLENKMTDAQWKSVTLVASHRCRKTIADFVNRTASVKDMHRRQIEAAEIDVPGNVCLIPGSAPSEIAAEFLRVCKKENIDPSEKTTAILYGAHSSALSRSRIARSDIEALFATDNRERYAAVPIALQAKLQGNNPGALREAMELVYQLKFNVSSYQARRKSFDCEFVESLRPLMWKFLKRLPDVDLTLSDWVAKTNQLLAHFLPSLQLDCEFALKLSKVIGSRATTSMRELLLGSSHYATGLPFTVTNVHQVKGRTFDAVLLYLDTGNRKISGGKLCKLLQGTKPLAKMTEDDRCIYVAITRARKLLCFAGDIEGLSALSLT